MFDCFLFASQHILIDSWKYFRVNVKIVLLAESYFSVLGEERILFNIFI